MEFVNAKQISNLAAINNKVVDGTVIQLVCCGNGISVYNKQLWLHNMTDIRKETNPLNSDHYPHEYDSGIIVCLSIYYFQFVWLYVQAYGQR